MKARGESSPSPGGASIPGYHASMAEPLDNVRDISRIAYGFMASKGLFAALDLDLFGLIARAPKTADALAADTGL